MDETTQFSFTVLCFMDSFSKYSLVSLDRVIESLRLERTSEIIQSNHQLIHTMPINHVPKCHNCTFLEHLQEWW